MYRYYDTPLHPNEQIRMPTSGWITMVVVLGFVWGGFLFLLVNTLRSEKRRSVEE